MSVNTDLLTPAEREEIQVALLRIHNGRLRRARYAVEHPAPRVVDPALRERMRAVSLACDPADRYRFTHEDRRRAAAARGCL